MSSIIQPDYGTRTYHTPAKAHEAKQAGTQSVTNSQTQAVSDRNDLENFKKEIWSEIDSMSWGSCISVQITDDSFEKMMADIEFKNKMMNLIQEDARGSNTMCGGTVIRIDRSGYSGYSYMEDHADAAKAAVETHSKGKSAFYTKMVDKKRPLAAHSPRTESVQRKPELSEAEELRLFKESFYEDLSKIPTHPSICNAAVNISDEAFQAMKDDPEYRAQVLSLLERDFGGSVAPLSCSLLLTVGTSLDQYRGDSWSVGYDLEFSLHSQNSFYKATGGSGNRQKERLEDYQERKLQAKRRRQALQEKAARERQRMAQIGVRDTAFSCIADLLKMRAAPPEKILLEGANK